MRSDGDYTDRIKIKTATTNPEDKDKCFQYSVSVALNHEKVVKDLQRVWKTKPFLNKYNWKGITLQTGIKEC